MQLNLPILEQLKDRQRILIAGAGGGFDVFAGLPIYFTLRDQGKTVHLANYSFSDFRIASVISQPQALIETLLVGAHGNVERPYAYYPEGYLAQWFNRVRREEIMVWMFAKTGVEPLALAYQTLIDHLGGIDALILVDGGVDALMRGDEAGAGTLLEDTVSLAAVDSVNAPVKILACLGFGTEVEEAVCHYTALENIAALTQAGAFLGACALTPQMEVFRLYEEACRYVWEQPNHEKSHISTRIIPAVNGQFGDYHMYQDEPHRYTSLFISPLMSLYWFFNAQAVIERNILVEPLRKTLTFDEVRQIGIELRLNSSLRPRRPIPFQ